MTDRIEPTDSGEAVNTYTEQARSVFETAISEPSIGAPMSDPNDTRDLTEAINAYDEQTRHVENLRAAFDEAAQARDTAETAYREAQQALEQTAAEIIYHYRNAVEISPLAPQ